MRLVLVFAAASLAVATVFTPACDGEVCPVGVENNLIQLRRGDLARSNDQQILDVDSKGFSCRKASDCVVPAGKTWYFDKSISLRTLTVQGKFEWDTTKDDLTLRTETIILENDGHFQVGTESNPMEKKATIFIKDRKKKHDKCDRGICGNGKNTKVEMHGRVLQKTWTQLASDAGQGSTEIQLKDDPSSMGWRIGDRIGIATTSRGKGFKTKIKAVGPATEFLLKATNAYAGAEFHNDKAGKAIDGNMGSPWNSYAGKDTDHWITIVMPSKTKFTRTRFLFSGSRFCPAFDVLVKTDGKWNTATSVTGGTAGWNDVDINAEGDKLKLVCDPEEMKRAKREPVWAGLSLKEVEIYGLDLSTTTPTVVFLEDKLQDTHWGGHREIGGKLYEMAAEVVNLDRSIEITGDHEDFEESHQGFHTKTRGGVMDVRYTRLEYCGQRNVMGRYCLHWHLSGKCPTCTFKGNAVDESQQIGITIHGTHDALVDQNVLWDTRVAGIYIEDGNEMNNVISNNAIICSDWKKCSVGWQGKSSSEVAGIYMVGMSNDLIGNHIAGHENCIWTPGSSRQAGAGAAHGKVCPQYTPFGKIKDNVNHDCQRFGLYLDNQYPRNIKRDEDGYVTDRSSCDQFDAEGKDNGIVPANLVENELDYHNMFVGQYSMGDIAFKNLSVINNAHSLYWKTTKDFADGRMFHIEDSVFIADDRDGYGSLQLLGPGGPFTFGLKNVQFIGGRTQDGALKSGQHCGLMGAGGPCATTYLLENVDFSKVHSHEKRIKFGINSRDPGYVLPIFVSFDGSLGGKSGESHTLLSRHLDGFKTVSGCDSKNLERQWDEAVSCHGKTIRRLNLWPEHHQDLKQLRLRGPGYQTKTNWNGVVHGMNSGRMDSDPLSKGYGWPVIAGEEYKVEGDFHTGELVAEFSDSSLTHYLNDKESISLQLGSEKCTIKDSNDRRYLGNHGSVVPHGKKMPQGACRGGSDNDEWNNVVHQDLSGEAPSRSLSPSRRTARDVTVGSQSSSATNCSRASKDSKCGKAIGWAMSEGIHSHPEWYPGLTKSSSFEDFQAHMSKHGHSDCPKPCL